MYDVDEIRRSPTSRRRFMTAMTAAGLGAAAASLLTPARASAAPGGILTGGPTDGAVQFQGIPGKTQDIKVLNFALILEILEADLYRQALNAASGRPLGTPLSSNAGSYQLKVGKGGLPTQNANDLFRFLVQFTYVEAAHRDFLRTVIRSVNDTPVAPNPGGYRFPGGPGGDIRAIMSNILPLEETGVRAYLGAAPYISSADYIQAAGTIFSTEARHSGVIASELLLSSGPMKMPGDLQVSPNQPSERAFEYFLKPTTVVQRAKKFFA